MIVQEGWSSPYACAVRFYHAEMTKLKSTQPRSLARDTASRNADTSMAIMLTQIKEAGVLMPNGDMRKVDSAFVSRILRVHPFRHGYFNLETGIVGDTSAISSDFLIYIFPGMRESVRNRIGRISKLFSVVFASYIIALLVILSTFPGGVSKFWYSLFIRSEIGPYVVIFGAMAHIAAFLLIILYLRRIYLSRRKCREILGGRVMLPTREVNDFFARYYPDNQVPESAEAMKGGRPRHPAYDWYAQRGFERGGLSMNALQREMPRDDKGNPPSATTIREWEREHLQQKGATETIG